LLLTKEESNANKDVLKNIKFSIGFTKNIKNIFDKKSDFGEEKMDD
jgi:hypothetical protein